MRMERVVANLLDTARLESGMLQLKIDWCDIQDLLGTALQRLHDRLQQYSLKLSVAEELPLVRGDFVLLDHPSHLYLPYHAGVNCVATVVKRGEIVYERPMR